MRDNLGRHWRFNRGRLEAFYRNERTGKDSVDIELDVAKAKKEPECKCGGTMMRVVGVPKLFGEWLVCGKCSAEVVRKNAVFDNERRK